MATSRRTRTAGRPSSRQATPAKAEAESALEPNDVGEVAAIDPAESEPAVAAEAEQAGSSASSSGLQAARGRSSRRMQAQSSAKNVPAYKSGRVLTPAERAARSAALMSALKLLVILILFIGAVGAGWYFFIRTNPAENKATDCLHQGTTQLALVQQAIGNRQPAKARLAYAAGLKALQVPELGNAKEPIDPHDANLASMALAMNAVALYKQIRETEPEIDKVERDIKAQDNQRKVLDGFGKLLELDEAGLVELEKRANLFMANPVEPDAGARDEYAADYRDLVSGIRNQMAKIEQEKDRRLASITSDQERKAHGEVDYLVKQELFKQALDKLDDYKGKFEKGNFDGIRSFVDKSAKEAWESAKGYAESRYTDYKAPGIPATLAKQALQDARTRLQQVVDRFGVDDYVNQAKELLSKYPTP